MRRVIAGLTAIAISASAALYGCGYFGGDTAAQVAKVQNYTATICGFIPTAAAVGAMLTAGNPTVVGVEAIAQAICTAITSYRPQGVEGDQPCPQVNGVCIEGEWVRGGDKPK